MAMSGNTMKSLKDSINMDFSEKRKKNSVRHSTLLNQGFTAERPVSFGHKSPVVTRKKIREPLSPTVLIKEKFDSSERVGERRQGNDLAHIELDSSVHSNVIRTIDLKVDKQ